MIFPRRALTSDLWRFKWSPLHAAVPVPLFRKATPLAVLCVTSGVPIPLLVRPEPLFFPS